MEVPYASDGPVPLGPDEFYYHALYEPNKFLLGAPVGGAIDARQILIDFSNEPDWDMDQNLELSWMQGFHGGSQGYRHMYYPSLTFHLPLMLISQGKTPERAELYYSFAKEAFARNDTYWGFRFLARTMHHMQDMAQPFHTRQLYWRFICLRSIYDGTTEIIKNYHFAYESYQANLFRLEQQGAVPESMTRAVSDAPAIETESVEGLVKRLARKSHANSARTMKYTYDFLDKKYRKPYPVEMTTDEFFSLVNRTDKDAQTFNEDLVQRVELIGTATKSFLDFAYRDIGLDQYTTRGAE